MIVQAKRMQTRRRGRGDGAAVHIRVKICGIRSVDVALACAGAGADFLGYNFAPISRRRTDTATASRAIETLKASGARGSASEASLVQAQSSEAHANKGAMGWGRGRGGPNGIASPAAVGIFVNQSAREIDEIARECGLDIVQLSGTETPDECAAIAETTGLHIIKTVRLTSASDHEPINSYASVPNLFALLADTPGTWGGTGEPWDYATVRNLASRTRLHLFVAGGLTPETVAEAIHHARPWGVDVASGVETNGMTDPARVQSFIKSVRTALLAPVTSGEA